MKTTWEGRTSDVDEEILSVRSLDQWQPLPSTHPPPTERLYLNFEKLPGRSKEKRIHGHTPFDKKVLKYSKKTTEDIPVQGKPATNTTLVNDVKEINSKYNHRDVIPEIVETKHNGSSARPVVLDDKASTRTKKDDKLGFEHSAPRCRKRLQPHPDNGVIVPDLKRSEDLVHHQKKWLNVQLKVLNKLEERCSKQTDAAKTIFKLFRSCDPDEFGFVSKESFVDKLGSNFELSSAEASKLFEVGDAKNQNELNYLQFREVFKRVDTSNEKNSKPYRRILKHVPSNQPQVHVKGEQGKFSTMSQEEKAEFRIKNRIGKAIEKNRLKMMERFKERKEDGSKRNVHIRTRLGYSEASDVLKDFGVDVEPNDIKKYYHGKGENGITLSQLAARTTEYFSELDGNLKPNTPVRNMELKGLFLGCRAGKSDKRDGNLFTDMKQTARKNSRERILSNVSDYPLSAWKTRWTNKTLDRKPKVSCGENIRATTEVSAKMFHGNGNFLTWPGESRPDFSYYRHKDTSRSIIDTGRSIVETSRSVMQTSRSFSSILSTPYGTNRDY